MLSLDFKQAIGYGNGVFSIKFHITFCYLLNLHIYN